MDHERIPTGSGGLQRQKRTSGGWGMVAYAAGAPTMEEMICLYLYDDIKPPPAGTLKTKQDVLALAKKKPTRQDVEINKNWFMTQGGGRFMHIARFNIVRRFLAKKDNMAPCFYTVEDVFDVYHVPKQSEKRQFGLKQYEYAINDSDFTDRCEVFGSSDFRINPMAQFIINPNGTREIHRIWVEPVDDDYDYESSSWEAKISNAVTEGEIDPWGIGRKVAIKFTGNVHRIHNFSERDLSLLETQNRQFETLKHHSSALERAAAFLTLHNKKMDSLRTKGILYAKTVLAPPLGIPVPPLPPVLPRKLARDEPPPLLSAPL
ncbi:MAG: hypothetical protein LBP58_09005 [Azoarcus sp.]|jgi:hypothetical protein|nr:hypothetical protein [Azoarcus sp.]